MPTLYFHNGVIWKVFTHGYRKRGPSTYKIEVEESCNWYICSRAFPDIIVLQRNENHFYLKGYLHYKMITAKNVPSEAAIKNFFVS